MGGTLVANNKSFEKRKKGLTDSFTLVDLLL